MSVAVATTSIPPPTTVPPTPPRLRASLLLCTLLACATTTRAQEGEREGERGPVIKEVELRGVTKVEPAQLREGIATKASQCRTLLYTPICWITKSNTFYDKFHLDARELRLDVLRIRLFYWQRGYRDARVASRTEPDGNGVRVIFDVTEGAPTVIETLDVKQSRIVLPRRAVSRALQIKSGDPLNIITLDSTVGLLHDELWERGYADAQVVVDTTQVNSEANRGPVVIELRPGTRATVDTVVIDGARKVSQQTVRRLLSVSPGAIYRRSDVLRSQRDLYLSGLFSEVDLELPPAGDSAKTVRLRVTEADHNRLELSTGFTNADFLQVEAQFTRYDFLGSARRITLHTTLSNLFARQLNATGPFQDVTGGVDEDERDLFLAPTWAASIDFTQPWFLSPRNQLGASVFAHRRNIPGIVVDRGQGATVNFTRGIGQRSSGTLGYTYETSRIEASDVYFCVTFGLCVPSTIRVVAERNPLAPVTFSALVDAANHPFSPDAGFRGEGQLEHASGATLSDFRYNRAAASGTMYRRMSKAGVLAARVRLGWVGSLAGTQRALGLPGDEETVHPRKRFYAGGSQSVRGFGENQLGPRVLTIAPEALTRAPDSTTAAPCTMAQLRARSCDPNSPAINVDEFQPQPLGGTSLVEASVEYRFALGLIEGLSGAVFVDGALIGTDRFSSVLGATGAITPGFGVRFATPVGPVRLDLGIRPTLVEDLPVITQVDDSTGSSQLVTLTTPRRYDPVSARGNWFRQVLGRLMLHLSVGPAF